jgi:hypothetical protein
MTPTSPEEDSAQFYHPLSELLSEGQICCVLRVVLGERFLLAKFEGRGLAL